MLKTLQDILTDNIKLADKSDFGYFYPKFDLHKFVYKQSIINMDDYYRTSTIISYKTSNNQEIIDNMPYFVFNNFMVYLNEIIEKENGGKSDDEENHASEQMAASMQKAKSMMPSGSGLGIKSPKLPGIKTPKF